MKTLAHTYPKQPIGKLMSNIGKALLQALNERLKNLAIERNFYALILIDEGKGNLTQQDLADLLEIDKVSVVRIVDYLTKKGYIKRVSDLTDRRKYRLVLTAKAVKELPIIKTALKDVIQSALKGLSQKEIDDFNKTLNKIKENINQ